MSRSLRRKWYRLLAVGPLFLLLAFMPSLVYIDHWGEFLNRSGAVPPDHIAERIRQGSHELHCHFGPSTCSGQPVAPSSQILSTLVELPEPEFPAVLLEDHVNAPEEVVLSPPTEPPRL